MKKTLTVRQICFILFAYNAVLKLIIYPSAAAASSGNDIVFPALVNLVLQTAIIWSVAFLCSRTDKTFFALLSDAFGRVTARIIYALFALFFLLATVVPMNETQLLVHYAFYDTVPSLYVFLPIFFFLAYAGAKGFKNMGRCADIGFPIFAFGAIALIIMSVGQGEYSNLLPVFGQSLGKLAGAALSALFRFSDGAVLLMFMGNFNYKKGDAAKITLSYVGGGLVVVALLAINYALYGPLASSRTFLMNNISAFFSAISYIGRLDFFVVYALSIVVLFAVVMYVQLCVHCLTFAFGWEKRSLFSLCVTGVLLIITFILNNRFANLQEAASRWFWIPVLIFGYLAPVLAWTLKRRER